MDKHTASFRAITAANESDEALFFRIECIQKHRVSKAISCTRCVQSHDGRDACDRCEEQSCCVQSYWYMTLLVVGMLNDSSHPDDSVILSQSLLLSTVLLLHSDSG